MKSLEADLKERKFILVPVFDGKIKRFDRNGNNNGWCVGRKFLSADKEYFTLTYGDWKTSERYEWTSLSRECSKEEHLAFVKILEEQRILEHTLKEEVWFERSFELEREFMDFCESAPLPSYLVRKKIDSLYGARVATHRNGEPILVIPMADVNGKFWNYQTIFSQKLSKGDKFFQRGAKTEGCFFAFGPMTNKVEKIFIAEGFATAASIFMALGRSEAVLAAFNANNLINVAQDVKRKWPQAKVVICADNDAYTKINDTAYNIGTEKAKKAAEAVLGRYVSPAFLNPQAGCTDFNDLHLFEGLQAVAYQIRSETERVSHGKLNLISIGDLFAMPPETNNWLVDGLLIAGGTSLFVAKPKVGKSTLVRQLALAVARGEPFLNRNTRPGPVIYLAVEERNSELKTLFTAQGATGKEQIYIQTKSVSEIIEDLKIIVREQKISLVILDTLFKIVQVKDGNDYAAVVKALAPLHDLARETNAHVALIHHAGKGVKDGADVILGSTAIFGSVDTAVILGKDKAARSIETEQRYGQKIERTLLIFDEKTKTMTLGSTKKQATFDSLSDKIISCLRKHKAFITENIIAMECSGNKEQRGATLRELLNQNIVVRSGEGKKGNPYVYDLKENMATRAADIV